jgi:hypothetical protein
LPKTASKYDKKRKFVDILPEALITINSKKTTRSKLDNK